MFRPHDGAHRVAARAGLSVLVPLLVLWGTGHLEWAIYATFGAFTSLYGRNHVHLPRLLMQAQVGVLLTGLITLGALVGTSSYRSWLAVPIAALVALTTAVLSDRQGWHPPGALFAVFTFAACAALPTAFGEVLTALVVAGSSAGFAVVVGCGASLLRWRRASTPEPGRRQFVLGQTLRYHALPSGAAVLIAGSLATGAGIGHPYWAMVSAVVPLVARDFTAQVARGLHRLLGTGAGLVLAALLFQWDPRGLVLIGVIVVLQVAAEFLVGRNYAVALIAVTPLALLMVGLMTTVDSRVLLLDRGVETVIGVLVGLLVGYAVRPRTSAGADRGGRSRVRG